jgi:ABC-type phosphate transport system auxiliary subunit
VPVTAKLSRKFYDALGDEVANELVEWFNQVDLTYRTELRDLNEVNFARFDARLEQRLAELRAELRTEFREGFVQLDAKLEQQVARLDGRLDRFETRVDAKLDRLRAELIKWMFVFWLGTVGLVVTLVTQLH